MNAVSVAWRPIEWKWAKELGRAPGRDFTKTELLEISAVPLTADPSALVAGRSLEREERMALRALAQPKTHEPPFRTLGEQTRALVHHDSAPGSPSS
jgi:hypothetical protein